MDTKYEFGRGPDGQAMLIDEVHTPDSSRFWKAESYAARLAAGEEPENFDKEFVRLAYAAAGYRGDGDVPPMSDDSVGSRQPALYHHLRAPQPRAVPARQLSH